MKMEFKFRYPEKKFKHYKEELTQLTIGTTLDLTNNIEDLIENFDTYYKKCKNYDDVEYLA